jgi:hypothetical protein
MYRIPLELKLRPANALLGYFSKAKTTAGPSTALRSAQDDRALLIVQNDMPLLIAQDDRA